MYIVVQNSVKYHKMKHRSGFKTLLAIFFAGFSMYGQTYKDDASSTPAAVENSNKLNLYTSQYLSPTSAPSTSTSVANQVFISQIGNNNSFNSNIRSVKSNLAVFQTGNNNEAVIDQDAVNLKESVIQFGNNNVFYDLGSSLKLSHDGQIIQRGNNQRLLWLGDNSISDRLRVSMQGNNQRVIIRNIRRQ